MTDPTQNELVEIGDLDLDQWNDYAIEQGWSDGLPLMPPVEEKVERMVDMCRGDNEPFPPMSPRRVIPTLRNIAANAVMAGCRPEYFPTVVAAVRAVLNPDYNLHGTLATTHPCAQMMIVSGPVRHQIGLNYGSNCFGQATKANATIGRALQLTLLNVGGAKPGDMDRATHGSPAKYSFCFGENEEESPWEPYHVRRGFAAGDSVVTVMAGEGPHNINDHSSNTGKGLLTTVAGTISQAGANVISADGPYFVILGPEHAKTIHRDGWTIEAMQEMLYEATAVDMGRISQEQQKYYEDRTNRLINGRYYLSRTPSDVQILVAGGPGKHSAYVPSFGHNEACSVRIANT